MAQQPKPTKKELQQAALAWAEFLYDEYMLKKHKQLLLGKPDKKIEVVNQGGEGQL